MLLLAHIDVVDAKAEDLVGRPRPFKLTERDGLALRPRRHGRQGSGGDVRGHARRS
jgi:acetylornithine deacetylase/succinyl-diaminopimelate desuccinylase-like protein